MLSLHSIGDEKNSIALALNQSKMYSSTGSKSSFHLREAVAYLEKENALLRNNLMECSAAKEKLHANLLEKETTLQNALTQLSVSKANMLSLREQLKSESIIADKSTKSMIESMQEKSKYSAQQVMSLESTLNTVRVELHKERTARNIEVGNLRDQLRETKDNLLVTEGTVSDLQKIIKGLRSQNELTDSPSLRAYIRDTAARHQPTSIPRPNSQNSKKLSEKALTEPIKLAQPTSNRYHTSLSAARIRARSLSPTSASARKAIKSPYTYTSGFSRSSKTKSSSSSSSSGGYYLLDSEPNQSEHVTHSFNNAAVSDTSDPAPRSKSLDDFEVVSTISLQDQLLSQHTDKEDTSGAGVQQQSGAPKNTHELRGQFTQTSPSQVVEKVTTPGNISSVTAASSSIVDTYFRSMTFSTDDQHNSIHRSGKSPFTSTSPPSSASSTIENRARSPKASRALHSFSASESSSLDSYGVDNHPNLQPESKARSNSPKRSASQEFVDSVYGTPEKRRVKTENSNTSGSTSVRQSKPMTFPPSISPSKSFSRSQSTSAEETTSSATQSLLCFSPKKRLTELDIGADVYMYRTNSFQSNDKHATTVIMHTLDRYNSLVDEYNRLFQSLPPEERQKHLLRESQVQQQGNTPKRTDRSNPNPFQEELLSINEQLLTENSKLTKDLNEVRAMISTQLHKMKNENLTLLLQIHEQGEKLNVYDNLTRVNIGPGIPEDDGVSEVLTKLKEARHSDRHSEWLLMDFKAAEKIVRYFDSISQNMQVKRDAKIFSDLQQQQVVLPYGESVRGINNLKPPINPSDQYHNPSENMLSLAVSGESKIANTTSFHQSLGDLKNRCDSLQQELTSYGPPPSLSVAMAEKRVLECKLQETVTGFERNTALLEGQYLTAVSELRAFLKLEKSEKVNLQSKLAEQSQTISQLTHHLKQLQCRTAGLT